MLASPISVRLGGFLHRQLGRIDSHSFISKSSILYLLLSNTSLFSTNSRTLAVNMVSFTTLTSAAAVGILSFFVNSASAQDWSVGQPRENCDVPDYAQIQGAGGGDGLAFCGSKFKEGILIKKIEVQGHYEIIRGITVTYTDNTYDTFGLMDFDGADESRRNTIEFDPTVDSVTKAEIWPNGWNAHGNEGVASLVLEASNGGKIGKPWR